MTGEVTAQRGTGPPTRETEGCEGIMKNFEETIRQLLDEFNDEHVPALLAAARKIARLVPEVPAERWWCACAGSEIYVGVDAYARAVVDCAVAWYCLPADYTLADAASLLCHD